MQDSVADTTPTIHSVAFAGDTIEISYSEAREAGPHAHVIRTVVFDATRVPMVVENAREAVEELLTEALVLVRNPPSSRRET